jgi:hypothetical protein
MIRNFCWRDALTAALAVVAAALIFLFAVVIMTARTAEATWKPEYGNNPEAIQRWFSEAAVMPSAQTRLGVTLCCHSAERLMTKFVGGKGGDDWSYYPDPNCTHSGCTLLPIPSDVVHDEPIGLTAGAHEAFDKSSPEDKTRTIKMLEAMKREGVLFIYRGSPSCFWPPEGGF